MLGPIVMNTRTWKLVAAYAAIGVAMTMPMAAHAQGGPLCERVSTQALQLQCVQAVAGQRVGAAGAQLCHRISTNTEIVSCARAIAGYTQDAAALQVCGRISTNTGIVECLVAIRNKTYAPEEISLCGRSSTNDAMVQCMRATGRVPPPPQANRPVASPPGAPQTATPTRLVIVNNTNGAIYRIYVRHVGTPWPRPSWRGTLSPHQQQSLNVNSTGRYGVCVETPEGFSLYWADLTIGPEGRTITVAGDPNWVERDCAHRR